MHEIIAARKLNAEGKEIQIFITKHNKLTDFSLAINIIAQCSDDPKKFIRTFKVIPRPAGHEKGETNQQKAIRRMNLITEEQATEWLTRKALRSKKR